MIESRIHIGKKRIRVYRQSGPRQGRTFDSKLSIGTCLQKEIILRVLSQGITRGKSYLRAASQWCT